MTSVTSPKQPVLRQRKAHKKSRLGCANCKLRSVKCDEAKPECNRCRSFGVACIYGSKSSPDALSTGSSFRVALTSPPVIKRPLAAPLPRVGSKESLQVYQLTHRDLGFIEKYIYRTALTIGTRSTRPKLVAEALPLALSEPCIMHAMLALAEIHDLSLSAPKALSSRRSTSLETHWHLAVTGFRRKIGRPIPEDQRHAHWLASCLLSIGATANIETLDSDRAWPLREPSPIDLSWLGMCEGKKVINEFNEKGPRPRSTALTELIGLSNEFYDVFDLHDSSEANPYYKTITDFIEVLNWTFDIENIGPYTAFICNLDRDFRDLLRQKDERAMLVLMYWYAKGCSPELWWLQNRAVTEGLAICEFIRRRWSSEPLMMRLLAWPESVLSSAAANQGLSPLLEPSQQPGFEIVSA